MSDIYTLIWVICSEWKDATSFDENETYQPTEGWIQRHQENQIETIMW